MLPGAERAAVASAAVRHISFGISRMALGYKVFEVTVGDDVNIDLGSPDGVQPVPASASVIARKKPK
jgi:hypothetical protein